MLEYASGGHTGGLMLVCAEIGRLLGPLTFAIRLVIAKPLLPILSLGVNMLWITRFLLSERSFRHRLLFPVAYSCLSENSVEEYHNPNQFCSFASHMQA